MGLLRREARSCRKNVCMLVYVCTHYRMLDVIPHVMTKEKDSMEDELRKKKKKKVNLVSECLSKSSSETGLPQTVFQLYRNKTKYHLLKPLIHSCNCIN